MSFPFLSAHLLDADFNMQGKKETEKRLSPPFSMEMEGFLWPIFLQIMNLEIYKRTFITAVVSKSNHYVVSTFPVLRYKFCCLETHLDSC